MAVRPNAPMPNRFGRLGTIVLVVVLLGGLAVASVRFLRSPAAARAAFFEPASGIWTLLIYLGLGIGPRLGRL